VHKERSGFNNPEWDLKFFYMIEHNPSRLAEMTIAAQATLGGLAGADIFMRLVIRGAFVHDDRNDAQAEIWHFLQHSVG
jgi:gallate dioxygenase